MLHPIISFIFKNPTLFTGGNLLGKPNITLLLRCILCKREYSLTGNFNMMTTLFIHPPTISYSDRPYQVYQPINHIRCVIICNNFAQNSNLLHIFISENRYKCLLMINNHN